MVFRKASQNIQAGQAAQAQSWNDPFAAAPRRRTQRTRRPTAAPDTARHCTHCYPPLNRGLSSVRCATQRAARALATPAPHSAPSTATATATSTHLQPRLLPDFWTTTACALPDNRRTVHTYCCTHLYTATPVSTPATLAAAVRWPSLALIAPHQPLGGQLDHNGYHDS